MFTTKYIQQHQKLIRTHQQTKRTWEKYHRKPSLEVTLTTSPQCEQRPFPTRIRPFHSVYCSPHFLHTATSLSASCRVFGARAQRWLKSTCQRVHARTHRTHVDRRPYTRPHTKSILFTRVLRTGRHGSHGPPSLKFLNDSPTVTYPTSFWRPR